MLDNTNKNKNNETFIVSGVVRSKNGNPGVGVKISATSVHIDHSLDKQIGSQVETDENGSYSIKYIAKGIDDSNTFSNGNTGLIVKAYSKEGTLLGNSNIICMQVSSDVKVPEIILDADTNKAPIEYDTIVAAITRLYKNNKNNKRKNNKKNNKNPNSRRSHFSVIDKIASWKDDEDIEVASCHTNIDKEKLKLLFDSCTFQKKAYTQGLNDLSAEVFYGLERQGIIPDVSKVVSWRTKNSQKALELSAKSNIISDKILASVDKTVEQLNIFMAQSTLNSSSSSSSAGENLTADLLKLCIQSSKDQLTFMKLYFDNEGTMDDFWKSLRENARFCNGKNDDDIVSTIQATFQIAELTHNNIPLVKALLSLKKGSPIKSIQELTALDYDDWIKLFDNTSSTTSAATPSSSPSTLHKNILIPPEVPGDSHDEKVSNYVRLIINTLEAAFPAPYIIRKMVQAPSLDLSLVRRIIELNPTFDPNLPLSTEDIKWPGDISKDEHLKQKAIADMAAFRHEINMYPTLDYKTLLYDGNKHVTSSTKNKKYYSSYPSDQPVSKATEGHPRTGSSGTTRGSNSINATTTDAASIGTTITTFLNPARENTKKFFSNCPDFDLIKHPIANYIENNKKNRIEGY